MDVEEIELLKELIIEQKQLKIKKARAKFRINLKIPNTDDKIFEKYWKII